LYGKWWSAEDAAYAKELELDTSLRAPDLERLWRTNRPSVREKVVSHPVTEPMSHPAENVSSWPQPDPVRVTPETTGFAAWLAGFIAKGGSVQKAAERFNVERRTIHRWKLQGCPDWVTEELRGG